MIRRLVDFALENRFLVLVVAILLFIGGAVSFHNLPVEAYPDVANNYVDVIAQWPGISAEQVEQQVTIPLETTMNGIPGIAHVRSWSIFGLSTVEMVFGEDTTDFENRERVLERLSQVTMPPGVVPQMGTDWSPVGQIYFYTLQSTNPEYDAMNLKSLETWVIEKNLKSVPGVPDTNPFGGPTREYQVRLDPDKLISYGLSIAQVEQQLTNNNANAGGSFIQAGQQEINVREVGLVKDIQDIENTVITTKTGTPLRVKDIAVVTQGPEIRLGQFGNTYRREDGKLVDNDDAVSGIAVLQKGDDAQPVLEGIHQKVQQLNNLILPKGVKLVPFIDRSDLLRFTTHTVLHNLTEGMVLVVIILFLFLGNVRGALIVALTIPFALLFAAICLSLRHIPANLLSLGALDFGMVVDGAVVMIENIVRHLTHNNKENRTPAERIREAAHEVQRPVFLRDSHHHHGLSAHLHAAGRRRAALPANGRDRRLRPAGCSDLLDADRPRPGDLLVPERREGVEKPGNGVSRCSLPESGHVGYPPPQSHGRYRNRLPGDRHVSLLWRRHRFRVPSASG